MISPALTLAHTGSLAQASTSLSSSLAINEVKKEFTNNLEAERICPTFHSSELNSILKELTQYLSPVGNGPSLNT